MRLSPVIVAMALLASLPEPAGSQARLPWESSGRQPSGPGTENITEAQLPMARARLEQPGVAWVGQAVPVVIEVIVPTWFSGAPTFPDIDIPDALTLSPEAAWNFVVRSGRQTFPAQARRFLVFPQAERRYAIPSLTVEVSYALPAGSPSKPVALSTGPLTFEARLPAGASDAEYFLTTDGFRIMQRTDPLTAELQVGGSLTRTVTMTARNTTGQSLPPLKFVAPDGIHLYPGMPRVAETAERGSVVATRTEEATYAAEKEGHYSLPGITVLWWNPQTKKMNRASVPAIELNVRAGAASSREVFTSSQADEEQSPAARPDPRKLVARALRWALAVMAAFLLLLLARRALGLKGRSLAALLDSRRLRAAESEAAWFRRFKKASLSNDPQAALRHLMRWLDRADRRPPVPLLRQLAAESGASGLAEEAGALNALLFDRRTDAARDGSRRPWSGRRLYHDVARARRRRLETLRQAARGAQPTAGSAWPALAPRLNPASRP